MWLIHLVFRGLSFLLWSTLPCPIWNTHEAAARRTRTEGLPLHPARPPLTVPMVSVHASPVAFG